MKCRPLDVSAVTIFEGITQIRPPEVDVNKGEISKLGAILKWNIYKSPTTGFQRGLFLGYICAIYLCHIPFDSGVFGLPWIQISVGFEPI